MIKAHKTTVAEKKSNKLDNDLGEIRPKWITYDGETLYEGIHFTIEAIQNFPAYVVPIDWSIEEGVVVGLHA